MSGIDLSVVIATHDNLAHLRVALEGWRRHTSRLPVELLVVEDGCTDGTRDYLAGLVEQGWDGPALRVLHEDDAHELMCTNRGFREARGELVLSWHDDMELRCGWMVPELIRTFRSYPEIGLLALSRGLRLRPVEEPILTWQDTIDWRRVESTIGPSPGNWLRLYEVDAVIRPWVVRRAAVERVGPLDDAFRPTEWDESDLCFRLRAAGWRVAAHGYEREEAYHHAVSSTYGRTPSEARMALGLRNGRLFFDRWSGAIRADADRPRRSWPRRADAAGWAATAGAALRHALGRRP